MEVWLNQTAEWSNTAAWYYWDEDTQTAQPYNQIPQSGDIVYLNGYNIGSSISSRSISFDGKITNITNPHTTRAGGTIQNHSGHINCKEIEVGNSLFCNSGAVNGYTSPTFTTTNGIYLNGAGALYNKGGNNGTTVYVNGNVYRNSLGNIVSGNTGSNFIMNGNLESYAYIGASITNTITINGNLKLFNYALNNASVSTFNVNGDVWLDNCKLNGTTTTLNLSSHNLYYKNWEALRGLLNGTNINIIQDDFSIHKEDDYGETLILSKYQLNNTDQYPSPANVKKDVPYAWGELVGQYLPDYPPETVVLKDYVYDNGEMVGTLDLPQAPTTSDIVTAIKNDSDLGGKINDITTNTENIKSDTENIISNTESIETNIAVANNKINDITTNTENIKSDTENIISNTNTIKNIAEDIQISTNNILSESSSINNKSDSIITTLNNTSPQINDLWNRLNDVLTARLGQSVTVEILEEVLTSQLNNQ